MDPDKRARLLGRQECPSVPPHDIHTEFISAIKFHVAAGVWDMEDVKDYLWRIRKEIEEWHDKRSGATEKD